MSRAGKVGISSAALPDQQYSDLKIAGKFDLLILFVIYRCALHLNLNNEIV